MTQIIATPQELANFANKLKDHALKVSAERHKLIGGLKALHGTWQDQNYRQFEAELSATMSELDQFVRAANRYADGLEDKARAGKRFINRSR